MHCVRDSHITPNREGNTSWEMVRPSLVSHSMGSVYVHWLFRFKSLFYVNHLHELGLAPLLSPSFFSFTKGIRRLLWTGGNGREPAAQQTHGGSALVTGITPSAALQEPSPNVPSLTRVLASCQELRTKEEAYWLDTSLSFAFLYLWLTLASGFADINN